MLRFMLKGSIVIILIALIVNNSFEMSALPSKSSSSASTSRKILLDDSVNVEISKEKIKLKLKNGQILIGNRKSINYLSNYTIKTKLVYEFLGLPFAQAPLNEKRFQFPYKLDNILTQDTYDATYFRPSCMQEYDFTFPDFRGSDMWNPAHNISEDCLYFNIWVPVTLEQDSLLFKKDTSTLTYSPDAFKTSNPKATLFWIYGGSFNSGSANLEITEGHILASYEDTIVITSNYRVGPFGFLFLNSSSSPGNAGLADQLMAIEWYREHYLDYFGASKTSVCLFGESAGSMSIHFMLLSNQSHLFNRGIFQSTSAFSDITYRTSKEAYRVSLSFAQKVGCLEINTQEKLKVEPALRIRSNILNSKDQVSESELNELNSAIFNCLLKQNASHLSAKQFEIEFVNEHLKMQFLPTSDYHKLINIEPDEYDFRLYKEKFKEHEFLVGINQDEASYFNFYVYNGVYFNFTDFFPTNLKYDNDFALKRLLESFKTKTVENEVYSSLRYNKQNIPVLNITSLKTTNERKVDEYFFDKYVKCVSSIYTEKNNVYYDTNGDLINFDLALNKKNSPIVAWKKVNKILGDLVYSCPSIKLANKLSEIGLNKTYFYKFNRRAQSNPWPKWLGAMHGYEIEYIFGYPWVAKDMYEYEDRLTSRKMMNYWANFARTGKLSSAFDSISSRRYYVELAQLSRFSNLTESDEYDMFNKNYANCELFMEQTRHQTLANKYEQCLKYQSNLSSPLFVNSSPKNVYNKNCFFSYYIISIVFLICFKFCGLRNLI